MGTHEIISQKVKHPVGTLLLTKNRNPVAAREKEGKEQIPDQEK